jgi:hypothetical protein
MQTNFKSNAAVQKFIVSFFLILAAQVSSIGQTVQRELERNKAEKWADASGSSIHFTENKGQIEQTNGKPAPYVGYLLERGNTSIYLLKSGGIAYQFNRMHYPDGYRELLAEMYEPGKLARLDTLQKQVRLETYRMDMQLLGANPTAIIIPEGKSSDYTHYYTHDVLFVHHYERITYKDVYPGIDWVIYTTTEGGMKYDFVVSPFADPSQIRLKFTHHEELYLDDAGNLIHGNRMGRFTEKAPVSFQNDKQVPTSYTLIDNILSFKLGGYDPSQSLTIDPNRIWGTFYGGADSDFGGECASDSIGNIYLVGSSASSSGIASGGFQNIFSGGNLDAFLVKFNSKGSRLWSTYYGGSNLDRAFDCKTDKKGNVYISGSTNSVSLIAFNGHQNKYGGGAEDAFLVKFDGSGLRLWGTYYGGLGSTEWGRCEIDETNNVFLSGTTTSNTSISFNGFKNRIGRDTLDAYLVKFNSSGIRQWATYYGGDNGELGYDCVSDKTGNIYLVGVTGSLTDIAANGHQNSYGGGDGDGFVVKFNSSGQRQWGTYYGGKDQDGFNCATKDVNGNIYCAGVTRSNNNISFNGHQNYINGGPDDAFLVKFNDSGVRKWSTYYGGKNNESPGAVNVDMYGNVYMAGGTASDSFIAFNGFQNKLGGYFDAFLVKMNSVGKRLWSTYYGSKGESNAGGCATDRFGNVYLSGLSSDTSGISFNGYQNKNAGQYDAFLAKFIGNECRSGGLSNNQICVDNSLYPNLFQVTKGANGVGKATGLPIGVSLDFRNDTIYFIGTPKYSGIYKYKIPLIGECGDSIAAGTMNILPRTKIIIGSDTSTAQQIACTNHPIKITRYRVVSGRFIDTIYGLPKGVLARNNNDTLEIYGSSIEKGSFVYRVKAIGNCNSDSITGKIFIEDSLKISLITHFTTKKQKVCVKNKISRIVFKVSGYSLKDSIVGLPKGITYERNSDSICIYGTSLEKGIFKFTVYTYGRCMNVVDNGEIEIIDSNTYRLTSIPGSDNQVVKTNSPITNIHYTTTGATGIGTPLNLPPGVSANYISNVIIISGTPTIAGAYSYRIPLTGGCDNGAVTGLITVTSSTGIVNSSSTIGWYIYPNPTTGRFVIRNPGNGVFDLLDITGQMLHTCKALRNKEILVDLQLPEGVYVIRERSSGLTQKVLLE